MNKRTGSDPGTWFENKCNYFSSTPSPSGKKQLLFWPISENKKAKKKAIRKVDVLNLRFKNEVVVLNLVFLVQISDLTIAETKISARTTTAQQ